MDEPRKRIVDARYGFRALLGLALLGLVVIGPCASISDDYTATAHQASARARGPSEYGPPSPVAPTIFRTAWQALLVAWLGLGLCAVGLAVVEALTPRDQEQEPHANGERKPPVLR